MKADERIETIRELRKYHETSRIFQKMKWQGPFKIEELLDNCFNKSFKTPESDSVYLVSQRLWKVRPDINCEPLYVGSNTAKSKRFRRRVGDLIADTFGFFQEDGSGHHSGGQSIYKYCAECKLNPKNLYIGWLQTCNCDRCAECAIYSVLRPRLNKNKPSICEQHFYRNTSH